MDELNAVFESARREVEAQLAPMVEAMAEASKEIDRLFAPLRVSLRGVTTWTF